MVQDNNALLGGVPTDIVDVFGISMAYMNDSGDWMLRGLFGLFDYWVLYNGEIVARRGEPIVPGSAELYTGFFTVNKCNSVGDYVIGYVQNSMMFMNENILVLNGR